MDTLSILLSAGRTMRAELAPDGPYVRRARPTFLYAMALSWLVQTLALSIAVVFHPEQAGVVITAAAGLTAMWGMALAVVGVAVKTRSDDKARALGHEVPTALQSIAGLLVRRRPA